MNELFGRSPVVRDPKTPALPPLPPWYRSKRHQLTLFCFLATAICYSLKFVLSQAIIPMSVLFNWDQSQQGLIQGIYYAGSMSTEILGGLLSRRFGGKLICGTSLIGATVLSTLTPVAAQVFPLIVTLRFVMGLFMGMLYPGLLELMSHWIMPEERTIGVAIGLCGAQVGTIFVLGSYPYLADWVNWSFPFYLYSGMAGILTVLWFLRVHNTPKAHPGLSTEERVAIDARTPSGLNPNYDLKSGGGLGVSFGADVPWRKLLFSRPSLTLNILVFSYCWAYYLLIINLPKYIVTVLGFTGASHGALAMLPYLMMIITTLCAGFTIHAVLRRGYPTHRVRQMFVSFGMILAAILFVLVGQITVPALGYTTLMFSIIASDIARVAFSPIILELAPNYTSVLMAIIDTIICLSGFLSPLTAGFILDWGLCSNTYPPSTTCLQAWNIIFTLSALIYLLGLTVWLAFGSSECIIPPEGSPYEVTPGSPSPYPSKPPTSPLTAHTVPRKSQTIQTPAPLDDPSFYAKQPQSPARSV